MSTEQRKLIASISGERDDHFFFYTFGCEVGGNEFNDVTIHDSLSIKRLHKLLTEECGFECQPFFWSHGGIDMHYYLNI